MGTCTYIDRGRLLECAPNGEKVALELGKPFYYLKKKNP